MKIGGLQKVSLLDFPSRVAAVVFTKGCNFRCPFCFNRGLVSESLPTISQSQVLSFLAKRKKILDGVVISGGEPLLQPDLKDFIISVKKMDYPVKLDTNGFLPQALKEVLKKSLLDYLALDFKASLDGQYSISVGLDDFDPEIWLKSFRLIADSQIPFELRTTVVPGIHDQKTLVFMAQSLKKLTNGRKWQKVPWFWQNFRPGHCLDPVFDEKKPYSLGKLNDFLKAAKRHYSHIILRQT